MSRLNRLEFVTVLFSLLVGVYFFILPITGTDFSAFPGDLGDARLNTYFLEHNYQYFFGDLTSYWDAPFMYPESNTLAYSDNLLGSAPFYCVFRIIGLDIYTSFQYWFIVLTILNFLLAYLFLKYLFKNNSAAIIGAFVFAFSMALQSQMTHAQMFPRYAIPLAFWMAVKFNKTLSPKYFFLTVLALVYQIYCGIYLGFMLFVPLSIFLLLSLLNNWKALKDKIRLKQWWWQISLSITFNALFLLPLMLPYLERKNEANKEHYEQISKTIPKITSHLYSQKGSILWDDLSKVGLDLPGWWNHQIFAGGLATISFIAILFWFGFKWAQINFKKTRISIISIHILSSIFTFLIFIKFLDYSAYQLIYYLPGFSALRSIARIINIELLFFSITTSYLFLLILKKFKNEKILLILMLSLFILDNYYPSEHIYLTKISEATSRTKILDNALEKIPKGSLVSFEPENVNNEGALFQIDAMLMAQKHNMFSTNGYSATSPENFSGFWNSPNDSTRNLWLNDKIIDFHSFYVINDSGLVTKMDLKHFDNIYTSKKDSILKSYIKKIKSNTVWLEDVKKKAHENNISLEEMLYKDAEWLMVKENYSH